MHPGGCGHSPLILLVGKPDHLHRQHTPLSMLSQTSTSDTALGNNVRRGWWGRVGGGCCSTDIAAVGMKKPYQAKHSSNLTLWVEGRRHVQ